MHTVRLESRARLGGHGLAAQIRPSSPAMAPLLTEHRPDPLGTGERSALMQAARPHRDLPLLARSADRRRLPLAAESRDIDKAYRPIYAVWEITLLCDLACRHCGSRAARPRPDELSTAECLDVVDQLADLGVMEVILIGGEVYLRDGWLDILRRIRDRGMTPLLTTGGRAFTRERAVAAKEAGLVSASVSLDGNEATHDRLRGLAGSHQAALSAMRNLREAGVRVSVNTQINRLSMPDLPDVLETLIGLGAHTWQIQITVAMGRAADEPEVLLQPYDMLTLFPMLDRIQDRCREARVLLWPGNNVGYFGPYETKLRGTMARGHMASCGAGRAGIGIESDGTLKGCPSLNTESWAAGNVREHKIEAIWERSAKMRYTRDRTVEDLWGYCRSCYYADTCLAGCTWTAESLLGRPGNNPLCHHRALEHQRLGKRERLVHVEHPAGNPFDNGRFELVVEDV
jgi:radical SAM protein with 4Fe4S-binding SPASM domain